MNIHLIGVCGMGMGSLAGLLQQAGHRVSGCDTAFNPPMSEHLRQWGIATRPGFDPAHLDDRPDLVVVGNVCRRDNPEARRALEMELEVKSFPQTLGELFIAGRRSVVVAGTHGKTTTTCLLAHLLQAAGQDPSFLAGGIMLDSGRSFRLGAGPHFVVEGDEYDSAFFDKRPKFVHYRPRVAVLTSLEYDHADIYPDEESYRRAFDGLLEQIPADGCLVACHDQPGVRRLLAGRGLPVAWYGLEAEAEWQAADLRPGPAGMSFSVVHRGREVTRVQMPLSGRHNVANALAALVVLERLGLEVDAVARHLSSFPGVARRLQVRGEVDGILVVDDFAHHPTEVRETVAAAARRFSGRQLVAVFEPRTNTSRRAVFQREYARAFAGASRVLLVPPFRAEQIEPQQRFDSARLAADLRAGGLEAEVLADAGAVIDVLVRQLREPAVVLVMSNGPFDDIHQRLLEALARRRGDR
ncbi:MAG: hypothetical protein DRI34_00990 [Deltaproteobacteria bacterium]|nr:MAG: hypothetical protein DRI34_00990 [Deltaproteobacteria bacterium]